MDLNAPPSWHTSIHGAGDTQVQCSHWIEFWPTRVPAWGAGAGVGATGETDGVGVETG